MFSAVICCAGKGTRLNGSKNKILLPLGSKPVFMHSVDLFKTLTDDVIVVSSLDDYEEIKTYHDKVVLGGSTRQESVLNGVKSCKYDVVLIHDGARPFVSNKEVLDLLMDKCDTSFVGLKMFNSLKDLEYNNLNRDNYVMALTPQKVLKNDYLNASALLKDVTTDDVSLIKEALDKEVSMVIGSVENFKITTMDDYDLALKKVNKPLRVGHSWDLHQLVEGRKLYLGGVLIPSEIGLLGHSDADCLLHAIAESFLGALALGDLGTHFPDNDPKYLNIDSKILLTDVYKLVLEKGYQISNLDCMIYCQNIKMKPYINIMRDTISKILNCSVDLISLKATTYEKLDAIGEGKAIAADATCLLERR